MAYLREYKSSRIPDFPQGLREKFGLPAHQNRVIILANNWGQYDEFKRKHNLDLWMCVYVPHDIEMMKEFFRGKSVGLRVITLDNWYLACSPNFDFAFDLIQQERELEVIPGSGL